MDWHSTESVEENTTAHWCNPRVVNGPALEAQVDCSSIHDASSDDDDQTHDERQHLLAANKTASYRTRHAEYATGRDSDNMGFKVNNNNNNDDNYRPNGSINWYIYLVTLLSAIGGFLFGYDTGIVSGAMVFIRDYFQLNNLWQEVVISVTFLFSMIFSMAAGFLTDHFGRKFIILLASFIFTVGGIMMAVAESRYVLICGRAVVGCGIGLASMSVPVYLAEVAPDDIRGKLVSINNLFITFGQFIAAIVAGLFSKNETTGWRWMLGLASIPAFLQLVLFFFMPQSPRWLVHKGRYEDALHSLFKFRATSTRSEVIKEFELIKASCLAEESAPEAKKSSMEILSIPTVRRALFVGCLLMMYQQLAGINTVMYYSATIIQMSGVGDKSTAVWLAAAVATINFVFSIVGVLLVERIGRRMLTLSSLAGVVLSLLVLAVGFQLAYVNSPSVTFHVEDETNPKCSTYSSCSQCIMTEECGFCYTDGPFDSNITKASLINGTCLPYFSSEVHTRSSDSMYCANGTTDSMHWQYLFCPSDFSWMTLLGLMLYLMFFAPGMGPMPWTITSEIYPLYARSFCYGISSACNWFFNLLVSFTFLTLTQALTSHGAFYLYSTIALSGWILFFLFIPETKGKSLEELSSVFTGRWLVGLKPQQSESSADLQSNCSTNAR